MRKRSRPLSSLLSRPLTLTDRLLSNGASDTIGYDRASRIDTIDITGPGGPIEALAYTRDPTGTIETRTDALGLHTYGYDQTKQLTSVDYPAASPFADVVWQYDDAGNRDLETTSIAIDYVANALNQYSAIDGVTQTYDDNGNLTDDGVNTYTFDAESRLASAQLDDGLGGTINASYTYDPFMRRVSKTVDGTTTYFLWSGHDLVGEYDAGGTRLRRYLYAGDFAPTLVQDPDGGGGELTYRVHTDHLDTPRHLTDATGTVVWQAQLLAFGQAIVDDDPDESPPLVAFHLRFPGQYADAESGLHYNRFRYYDSSSGRYISADPLGQLGAVNSHDYATLDPLQFFDQLGLEGDATGFMDKAAEALKRFNEKVKEFSREATERAMEEIADVLEDVLVKPRAEPRAIACQDEARKCRADAMAEPCPEPELQGKLLDCARREGECNRGESPEEPTPSPADRSRSNTPNVHDNFARGRGKKID